ncbi:hypothetical protein TSUD_184840 [Trifolium subterraneum]|uniref:At1g61320/AtMIF1 LRR domain-containing protein n=1 Tax=Trifolium subterraneum TaxID=3900 RepID=A0A2Z6NS86_TRISU|nr:hypothetical protein TSUD_184840 [Trifolium subterraneum]
MKVSGSSLKLKCLELVRCWELTKVEIFAEKLVSFKYYGSHLETEFKTVPSLVEASFGGSFVEFVRQNFMLQIKVLKLDITQNSPDVASPSLWRFTIKMLNTNPTFRTERRVTMECQYSLKELELVGFCGAACEVELVMHILENAVELQKITIDTRLPTKPKSRPLVEEHFKTWNHEENRKRTQRLKDKIPPQIEFVCL